VVTIDQFRKFLYALTLLTFQNINYRYSKDGMLGWKECVLVRGKSFNFLSILPVTFSKY